MSERTATGFTKWITQNWVRRFVFFFLFWTVVYRVGDYAFFRVFGWPLRTWAAGIFWSAWPWLSLFG
jgi:hypothetical protein